MREGECEISYCRHNGNDSDVYVYPNIYGGIVCVCTSQGEVFDKRSLLIEHLKSHLDSGDKVPERVFNRLEKEIIEFGDDC